ncbi:MAG: GTP-binding protein [Clostridia bacterium]|nr:GTP-binding protein [Clostridia bacterium]
MREQQIIPVYVITGFLESGKTTLIQSMIEDTGFSRGQKTLILRCEDGEVEYDDFLKPEHCVTVVPFEEASEMTSLKLKSINNEYKPERVIIEYNNVWGVELLGRINLPPKWEYVQVISLADGTTFDNYMTNMRQMMTDPMKEADLIMVNRCRPEDPKSAWRRLLKGVNQQCNIMFENLDGTTEDGVSDEDLPYDMKADIIDIKDEDVGIFYMDSLDHPDRYDGKTVRLVGVCYPDKTMPNGFYLFGREAMTCCADDIAKIGWVTRGTQKPNAKRFVRITARCQMMISPDGSQRVLMLHEGKIEPANAPKEEYVTFG